MNCKDSDVFALESSIEKILNNNEWKNPSEIRKALTELSDDQYNLWKSRSQNQKFMVESSSELMVENVMDRLCVLFPMKYQKQSEVSNPTKSTYKRTLGFKK